MENRKIKILAIDDNLDNLISIRAMISDIFPNFRILTALNGTKGLEIAESEVPDVILLDIIMPDMDGFEVCEKLKSDEKLCEIPVVFITALKGDKQSRIRALEVGAEAFLAKPVDEYELTAQIRAMLKINQANFEKKNEKERLAGLVEERTLELIGSQKVTLSLLDDLHKENDARKKSEDALSESEKKYRKIFENAQEGIFQTNIDGSYLSVNPALAKMYGFDSPEELINSRMDISKDAYADPNERNNFLRMIEESGLVKGYEYEAKRKDGSKIWFYEDAKAVKDKNGKILFIEGFVVDITERKRAEEKLLLSQQRLILHIKNTPLAVIGFDLNGNFIEWNNAAVNIFGYSEEEAIGNNWTLIVPQKISGNIDEVWKSIVTLKGGYRSSNENITKDGRIIFCEWFNTPLIDSNGKTIGVSSLVMDITDRMQAEEEIKLNEARLESLLKISQYETENIPNFLDFALDQAIQLTKSKIGYIYIYDEIKKEFTLNTWSKGVMKECNVFNPNTIYQLEKTGIWGEVVRQRNTIIVNDFQTSNPLKKGYPDGHVQLYRFLSIPVFSYSKIVAVVGVANKDTDYNNADSRELKLMMDSVWKYVERKQNEDALRESEEKYRLLHENSGIGIGYYKLDGTVISYNLLAAKNMNGVPEDFIGKSIYEIFPKEEAEFYHNRITKAALSDEPMIYEDLVPLPSGNMYFLSTFTKITDLNNNILGIQILSQDITELKLSEKALIASEVRYRSLFESAKDGILILDAETGMIVDVNPYLIEMLGYFKEIFIEKAIWEIGLFSDIVANKDNFLELQQNEYIRYDDLPLETAYGSQINVEFVSNVYLVDNKKVIQCNIHDITERKQAEEALRVSQYNYRLILDNINEIVYSIKQDSPNSPYGTVQFVSNRSETIIGVEPNEFLSDNNLWFSLVHPDDINSLNVQTALIFGKKQPVLRSYRLRNRKTSEYLWMEDLVVPEFDNYGDVIGIFGVARDVTERKRSEDLIKHEKSFSEMLIESLPGIFYMFDSNFTPLRWNHNKALLLGLSNEQMKAHNTIDFIADRDKEKVIESFKKTFIEGESHVVVHIIRHDGEEIAYHLTGKRLDTDKGPMLLGVGIDVNDRVKAENELIIALIRAEESDKLKTAFLQNMSHEIRTPLNGILGFSKLLQYDDLSKEEINEFTGVIQQSGNRLLEIVNNVLDISKIETGQVQITYKLFSINSIITDLYNLFSRNSNSKNIELKYHNYLVDKQSVINSDDSKINQILSNLISNALKFTKTGSIEFGYEIKNMKSSDDYIQFYVKDTGIGISKAHQARIFDRFTQIDLSITRGYEGAGLGLAICKGLVELLGGKIRVESEINTGTTFYFTLPYIPSTFPVQSVKIYQDIPMKSKQIKILIAEDDDTCFNYLSMVLKKDKFIILRAENGEQAIEIFKETSDIDIILMDMRMPVMNGYEATKQIKFIRPDLPVIAQTAYAFNEEKELILSAGCDDYISKPIDRNKLISLIDKYISL
jgi:PAS domain S-box-containing protein